MKKTLILSIAILCGFALFMGNAPAQAADQTFVTIGTGGVTGVYYPTGGAICRLVNKSPRCMEFAVRWKAPEVPFIT